MGRLPIRAKVRRCTLGAAGPQTPLSGAAFYLLCVRRVKSIWGLSLTIAYFLRGCPAEKLAQHLNQPQQ